MLALTIDVEDTMWTTDIAIVECESVVFREVY
jgi:hypothetical protein